MKEDITGFLDMWYTQKTSTDKYIIWGHCYGNPRFANGTWIHTSLVTTPFDECKAGSLIKTLNSTYKLGTHYNPLKGENN